LQEFGAQQVFVFGSLVEANGNTAPRDIDLAVSGLPKDRFFAAYGRLIAGRDHPFDLVDLDSDSAFVRSLRELGPLQVVA
jgi:predicted nucleotidyltransferase